MLRCAAWEREHEAASAPDKKAQAILKVSAVVKASSIMCKHDSSIQYTTIQYNTSQENTIHLSLSLYIYIYIHISATVSERHEGVLKLIVLI